MVSVQLINRNNLASPTNIHRVYIIYQRVQRFFKAAVLLHLMTIGGLLLFFKFASLTIIAFQQHQPSFFYCFIAGYGLVLIIFAQLDAYSRYQNYKKAKDLFHENGFKTRIVNLFINSHCQRDAIKIAADDLGFLKDLNRYYYQQGYKWFHILPDFIFHNPLIVFRRKYWERTLFEKRYKSKYFLW